MDRQRPLNKRGHRNAEDMASKFTASEARPDLIVSSPAKRALSTAEYFADTIDYPSFDIKIDERLYFCGVKGWISCLKAQSDEDHNVLLFGHNPEITQVIDWLTGSQQEALSTCTIVKLQIELDSWQDLSSDSADLIYRWSPKDSMKLISTFTRASNSNTSVHHSHTKPTTH